MQNEKTEKAEDKADQQNFKVLACYPIMYCFSKYLQNENKQEATSTIR